jgi:hypothetical protein
MTRKERTRDDDLLDRAIGKMLLPEMPLLSLRGRAIRDAEPLADLDGVRVERPEHSVAGRESTLEQRPSSLEIVSGLEYEGKVREAARFRAPSAEWTTRAGRGFALPRTHRQPRRSRRDS